MVRSFRRVVRFERIIFDDSHRISRTEYRHIGHTYFHIERCWYFSRPYEHLIDPKLCLTLSCHYTQYRPRFHSLRRNFYRLSMRNPTIFSRSSSVRFIAKHSLSFPGRMREFFDIFLADDSHHEMVELYSQIFDGEY